MSAQSISVPGVTFAGQPPVQGSAGPTAAVVVALVAGTTLTLTAVPESIDGVSLVGRPLGDLVLCVAQADPSENGPWQVAQDTETDVTVDDFEVGASNVSDLTSSGLYYWTPGNGLSVSNGGTRLTRAGIVQASDAGTLSLTGPDGAFTGSLHPVVLIRPAGWAAGVEYPTGREFRATEGASLSGTKWRLVIQPALLGGYLYRFTRLGVDAVTVPGTSFAGVPPQSIPV